MIFTKEEIQQIDALHAEQKFPEGKRDEIHAIADRNAEISKLVAGIHNAAYGRWYALVGADSLPLRLRVPNAEEQFKRWLIEVCTDPRFIPEYSEVIDWLTDSKSKGLLLTGMAGTGKTLIAKRILPKIINDFFGLVPEIVSATELNNNDVFNSMTKKWIKIIDDVGTEERFYDYGNNRMMFSELAAVAIEKKHLLIATTNLSDTGLEQKYGYAIIDRLRNNMRWVNFYSQSMRRLDDEVPDKVIDVKPKHHPISYEEYRKRCPEVVERHGYLERVYLGEITFGTGLIKRV